MAAVVAEGADPGKLPPPSPPRVWTRGRAWAAVYGRESGFALEFAHDGKGCSASTDASTTRREGLEPMTTFDDREHAFEKKFVHDAELQFKVEARARNLLCLWGANQIGKTGEDAVSYAKEVLKGWVSPGGRDTVEVVIADIEAAGAPVTAADVKTRFLELKAQAKQQVMDEN
jgi:hypothetical protein